MPYFSIIIPTYNSSLTLQSCLESVTSQTFKDFEILIIDGVSKDNTLDIVLSFNDTRIIILSEPDKGIYDAMNKGIKRSKGEWLYFLGSDDSLYDVQVLEYIYNLVIYDNLDVVYGNVLMTDSKRVYDGIFTIEKVQNLTLCHQAIFYRRKIFKDFGLYNVKYKVLADHDLNLKWFFSNRHKSQYVDKLIANYAETGFSSFYKDKLFYDDLPEKLLWRGLRFFSIYRLKELSIQTALNKKENHDLTKYCLYITLYCFFRFLNLVERKVLKSKI